MIQGGPTSPPRTSKRTSGYLLLFPVLLAGVSALVLMSPYGCERFTDLYPMGMERLNGCPLAVDALGGSPDKTWGLSNFRIRSSGQSASGAFTLPVRGTKQSGEYQFTGNRTFSTWTLSTAQLFLTKEQRIIDVIACSAGSTAGGSPQGMFESLCEKGDASACLALGLMIENALPETRPDLERARGLKERACQLGNSGACALLQEKK